MGRAGKGCLNTSSFRKGDIASFRKGDIAQITPAVEAPAGGLACQAGSITNALQSNTDRNTHYNTHYNTHHSTDHNKEHNERVDVVYTDTI
jgi:hypothetical protein